MALLTGSVVEFKKSLADLKLKDRQYSTRTKFITVMKSKETGEKPKRYLWTIRDELVQAIKELDFFWVERNNHQ